MENLDARIKEGLDRSRASMIHATMFTDILNRSNEESKGALNNLLSSSNKLLVRMFRRDWTDRALILLTFFVFCLVATWIIFKRLGGAGILRLFLFVWDKCSSWLNSEDNKSFINKSSNSNKVNIAQQIKSAVAIDDFDDLVYEHDDL